jgi:HSP20 family protein
LTDDDEDPVAELRLAATAFGRAARRTIERALDTSPVSDVTRGILRPRVRVVDQGDTILVTADLPGSEKDSIEVTLSSDNVLRIRGAGKRSGKKAPNESHMGLTPRAFERTVLLRSDIQREKATAVLENGVLKVTLPKRKGAASDVPKKQDVRAA